ncbi:interferon phi 3 [Salminus brasiliensis]|uniref:interferon phi 3 n=1 Tax=Salminus brasiliensis TaxID=930266 RepID=UPI003B8360AF
MAHQRFIWLSTLLCMAQVYSMPTKCELQRRLVETCHHLLESMGGAFPFRCFKDYVLVPFPKDAFESSKQETIAMEKSIYITLEYIDSMLNNDGLPDQWTAQEELDYFQHIVFRLIEENKCVMSKTQDSLDDFLNREASLRAYFQKITAVLIEKDFQYCAWEFARIKILRALQFILNDGYRTT